MISIENGDVGEDLYSRPSLPANFHTPIFFRSFRSEFSISTRTLVDPCKRIESFILTQNLQYLLRARRTFILCCCHVSSDRSFSCLSFSQQITRYRKNIVNTLRISPLFPAHIQGVLGSRKVLFIFYWNPLNSRKKCANAKYCQL